MLRAILFDFDGTVADTIPTIREGVNQTLAAYNFPTHTDAEIRSFINNGPRMLIRRALPTDKQTDEALLDRVLADFDRIYKTVCTQTNRPYDGIPELMQALRKKGYRIGVLSNKQDHLVRILCQSILPNLCDAVLGSIPSMPSKPDPYLPHRIAADLGVDPQECVIIGDSDVDFATACAAGMEHIGVTWGYRDEAFLRAHGATRLAHTPEELLPMIEQLSIGKDI